jgi:hypothetical protein
MRSPMLSSENNSHLLLALAKKKPFPFYSQNPTSNFHNPATKHKSMGQLHWHFPTSSSIQTLNHKQASDFIAEMPGEQCDSVEDSSLSMVKRCNFVHLESSAAAYTHATENEAQVFCTHQLAATINCLHACTYYHQERTTQARISSTSQSTQTSATSVIVKCSLILFKN